MEFLMPAAVNSEGFISEVISAGLFRNDAWTSSVSGSVSTITSSTGTVSSTTGAGSASFMESLKAGYRKKNPAARMIRIASPIIIHKNIFFPPPFPEGIVCIEGVPGDCGGTKEGLVGADMSEILKEPPWGAFGAAEGPGVYGEGAPPPDCAIDDVSEFIVRISTF